MNRDIEIGSVSSNPMGRSSTGDEGHIVPGFGWQDEQDADISIGRNSVMALTNDAQRAFRKRINTVSMRVKSGMQEAMNNGDRPLIGKFFLFLLVFPLACFHLVLQARKFVVLIIFNTTGFNLRPYALLHFPSEREVGLKHMIYTHSGLSFNKVNYLAERYLPYWSLFIMYAFIMTIGYNVIGVVARNNIVFTDESEGSNATNFIIKVMLSFILGFANLMPKRAIRSDISAYLSNFLSEELVIRDSPHTQLKSLTEVLTDIKALEFVLFYTQFGNPIVVTTKDAEQLCKLPEFVELLDTNTFGNNQTLRFIQLDQDVGSFYVMRDDIAVCSSTEALFFKCSSVLNDYANFKVRLDISDFELSFIGGAQVVLFVLLALFSYEKSSLLAFHIWFILLWFLMVAGPIFAFTFRKRKSKLASINFFTMHSNERKYQPFNNIIVASDDEILKKIQNFKFFYALFKFTRQSKYLIHTLLKCNENCTYDWINLGLKLEDFKRMAALAVSIYEKDVGIITPNAKVFYKAPRYSSDTCVVFFVLSTGVIKADLMVVDLFDRAAAGLRDGVDDFEVENTFFK